MIHKKYIIVSIQTITILFIGITLLRNTFFYNIKINGPSMEPTLHNNQRIYLRKTKNSEEYNRGDVIIFQNPESTKQDLFIKRIIGVEGDIVQYKNGILYINSTPIDEQYIKGKGDEVGWITKSNGVEFFEVNNEKESQAEHIPKGFYLVLGDNRNNSKDSRHFGYISKSQIVTKITK